LQKRLAERAKELEADNKDRQREREELEEMRLRVLTGGGNPAELYEKVCIKS
jgi:RNA-binding protein 25